MTLDLQLKLVKVNALKVKIVLPLHHTNFLWSQLLIVTQALVSDTIVLEPSAATTNPHSV